MLYIPVIKVFESKKNVIIYLMDNNKSKPKLVAEHPAACRRRRDGAVATCDDVVTASRWGVDCGCPRAMAVSRHCRCIASDMKARVH